jgi:hypothetical protein
MNKDLKPSSSHPDPAVQAILDQVPSITVRGGDKRLRMQPGKSTLNARISKLTRARVSKFLSVYADSGNISHAAFAAGIGRRTIQHMRDDYPEFAKLMDDCLEIAIDRLELEATRRARDGVLEPVVSKGMVVTHVRRYSDRLMEQLLAANRKKFQQKVDHNMTGTVSVQYQITGLDPVQKAIDVTPEVSEMATKRQPQAGIPAKTEEKGK